MKNEFRIKILPDPIITQDTCGKNYVDNIFKNDIDFNDVKSEIIEFVKVNYQPAVIEHLTPKVYVDTARDESSLLRLDSDEKLDLSNQDSIILNSHNITKN